ncbi:hypothetical protein WICPIJ_001501 [Wickerhamomyces pijperi]|uniref:Uncharacterized protein n=1 Tax=Wickerhamomyces pijperi TaxID=599730 RepID=A0A9P8QDD7_WICPI|nr:hypothetical protein WICPIJ_001501 [Wickerhamomyces pijperi]
MPAFEGFDDVDQSTQEVFETSDTESVSSSDTTPLPTSRRDSLSYEAIDIEQSRNLFQHSKANAQLTDFNGRVDKLLGSYETFTVSETTQEKLERIRRELEEVKEELSRGKTKETEKDLQQVEVLKKSFKDINRDVKEKALLSIDIVQDHIEPFTLAPSSTSESILTSEDLLKLNEKIQSLESILGYTHPLNPSETITTKLNSLYSKIQLLSKDTESLSTITSQIDVINERFESSLALRRQGLFQTSNIGGNTVSSEQQNSLRQMEDSELLAMYDKVSKLTPFIDLLPSLLQRLQSLHNIHLNSSGAVRFVNGLEEQLGQMEAEMNQWETSLNTMDGKIKDIEKFLKFGGEEVE